MKLYGVAIENPTVKDALIVNGIYIFSMIVAILLLWQCFPEGPWHEGTIQFTYLRYFWWICAFVTFYLSYTKGKIKENIISLFCSICLGPSTLLSMLLYYFYIKLKSKKVSE